MMAIISRIILFDSKKIVFNSPCQMKSRASFISLKKMAKKENFCYFKNYFEQFLIKFESKSMSFEDKKKNFLGL